MLHTRPAASRITEVNQPAISAGSHTSRGCSPKKPDSRGGTLTGTQALTVAGTDDPVNNKTSILTNAYTMPPFLMNDAQHATKIAAIVAEAQAVLAPYNITITTTRPASGTYDMMVAGGTPQAAGLPA